MIIEDLDFKAAEAELAERYARKAKVDAFDALVDMALDGQITIEEAKTTWEGEQQLEIPGTA